MLASVCQLFRYTLHLEDYPFRLPCQLTNSCLDPSCHRIAADRAIADHFISDLAPLQTPPIVSMLTDECFSLDPKENKELQGHLDPVVSFKRPFYSPFLASPSGFLNMRTLPVYCTWLQSSDFLCIVAVLEQLGAEYKLCIFRQALRRYTVKFCFEFPPF